MTFCPELTMVCFESDGCAGRTWGIYCAVARLVVSTAAITVEDCEGTNRAGLQIVF